MNPLRKYLKRVSKSTSGPTSYSSSGFDVTIGELEKVTKVLSIEVYGGGEYIAQEKAISANTVTVLVRGNIEQAVDEGGSSTYTIGGEVSSGANLSTVTFVLEVEGY